jgi:hypothetical protein
MVDVDGQVVEERFGKTRRNPPWTLRSEIT